MKLSLSVRIVESSCKTKLLLPFEEFVTIAKETGYDAICMRASAGGVDTKASKLAHMKQVVHDNGLQVSMVTADFDVPLNNANGPQSLRQIGPSLDVAQALDCDLIRVCLKQAADIVEAQQAADEAAKRGIRLAHQCHTSSLFEQVVPMLEVLAKIGRPNFGLIYEPANLMLCGEPYGCKVLSQLAPHLMNAYVQNHRLDTEGPEMLPTYCKGEVRYHHLNPWESGGIDLGEVFSGLHHVGYNSYFTIHQAQTIETATTARNFASRCAQLMRRWI